MTISSLRPWAHPGNIVVLHDYVCPWCWVGFFQAKKLTVELGVSIEWVGASLYPPELDGPVSSPGPRALPSPAASAPKSRFDLFCDEEQIFCPQPRPGFVRTHAALLAAEWATEVGGFDALNEAIYRAYWERCENIEDIDVLAGLARSVGLDGDALVTSVRSKRHEERVVRFDNPAYEIGVRNVPSFIFGGTELLAEAHYADLYRAAQRFLLRQKR